MDAQSLHKHNVSSSTKSRLGAKPAKEPTEEPKEELEEKLEDEPKEESEKKTEEQSEEQPEEKSEEPEQFIKNEEAIKAELHKEEFDQDGDGVVSLMEELDSAEDAKTTADEATAEFKSGEEEKAPAPEEKKEEDLLPKATILTMTEKKKPTFNAFSSTHASAPLPRQNHQAPVEEAKPVKDNTNAIIMILLIAILLIAVAIFGVIVLGEYRRDHATSEQQQTSKEETTTPEEEENKSTSTQYDFSSIVGNWVPASNTKSCFKIEAKGYASWYSLCDNLDKDHYNGKANVVSGKDAINLLGITKERAARMVGLDSDEINLSDIYTITIVPDDYIIDGASVAKPKEIRVLFVVTKTNEAQAFDWNLSELYVLNRSVEEDKEN